MAGSSNGAPSNTFNPGFATVSQKNEKIQAYNEVGIKFRAGVAKGLDEREAKTKEENSKKYDQWKVPLVPRYRGIDDHRSGELKFGFLTENQNNEKFQPQNNEKVGIAFPKEVSKEAIKGKGNTTDEGNSKKCEKWKVPLVQKFRGIDERAEEFIAKVRQDMKLEREQSIIEFEEMLKRSA